MRIGELAKATGTLIETIRFYERERLLPSTKRTDGNYRIYDTSHEERLSFIRHCRALDMTLDEIRALLRFKDAPNKNCGKVNALLDDHIGHVADRIRELRALERHLKLLRQQCLEVQGSGQECEILKVLSAKPRKVTGAKHLHVQGTHR